MDEKGGRGFRDGNRKREAGTETKYTYMTASSGDKYVKERKRAARHEEREKESEKEMRMSYNNRTRSQRSCLQKSDI